MIASPAPSTREPALPQHDVSSDPPWHTIDPDATAVRLDTSSQGLSQEDARGRLERDGPNQLPETPPTSPLIILLHQFRSPLIYILLAATVVTLLLEEFIDAGVIAAVLMLNAIIGFSQERRAEQSVRALMRLMAPKAHVVGREWSIESRELVAGDVVLLESGARVPADLRLFSTTALRVDESLLTGESLPVTKTTAALEPPERPLADRTNMGFMGTVVASGRARGVVAATGARTEIGAIADSIRSEGDTETPLQHRMNRFAHVIGLAVFLSASAAFAIGVALGESPSHMFMVAVALAVSAVPEGLPVVFTITLALAVRRMATRNAIVRRLPAVETLGSTTVIGSDKTGTLTENRMTVQEVWAGGQTITVGESAGLTALREPPVLAPATPLDLTLLAGVLTNEAELYRQDSTIETHGDPTEAASLVSAAVLGLEPEAARALYTSIYAAVEGRLKATLGGRVLLVSVVPPVPLPLMGRAPASVRSDVRRHVALEQTKRESAARQHLDRAPERLRRAGWNVTIDVRHGTPVVDILKAAKTWRADVLVCGARNTRGLNRLLLGSVADGLVSRSPVSVLVAQ